MIQEKTSVNWYAHGARYYDPQLARWHATDPLSELYASSSPYGYVINNPINFVDPDGMRRDPLPWGQEYNTRFLTDGERRLRADTDSWNNVGRFMSDPGPGAPITVDGETYTPYQDPITGSYYYDKEHQAYSEPYYSEESVIGYAHDFSSSSGGLVSLNYQKAGIVYHSAYTERIYLDASNEWGDFGWVETGFDHTGKTSYVAGLANGGRKFLEMEYISQANFNNSLAGAKNAKVVSSMKAISKTGKVLGVVGTVATYGVAGYQVAAGIDNTSTWVDVGVTTGVVVVGIISAPVAITAGVIYGGARLIWGNQIDGWVDSNWGYR